MKFFTTTLGTGGVISISASDSAMFVSVQTDSTSGGATVIGGIPFKGVASTSVALGAGQGINLSALSVASPLDGITITQTGGSVDVVIGF